MPGGLDIFLKEKINVFKSLWTVKRI